MTATRTAPGTISASTPWVSTRARADVFEPKLSRAEKTALVTRVGCLEQLLFERDGSIRPDVTSNRAEVLIRDINVLRLTLGWRPLRLQDRPELPGATAGLAAGRIGRNGL